MAVAVGEYQFAFVKVDWRGGPAHAVAFTIIHPGAHVLLQILRTKEAHVCTVRPMRFVLLGGRNAPWNQRVRPGEGEILAAKGHCSRKRSERQDDRSYGVYMRASIEAIAQDDKLYSLIGRMNGIVYPAALKRLGQTLLTRKTIRQMMTMVPMIPYPNI